MKTRSKVGLGLLALAAIGVVAFLWPPRSGPKVVEETRLALKKEGFKTELLDFDLTAPAAAKQRSAVLMLQGRISTQPDSILNEQDMMTPAGEHAAVVIWKQKALARPSGFAQFSYAYKPEMAKDAWPLVRELAEDRRSQLNDAAEVVLAGPIRFNLDASGGANMLLPHLASFKRLTCMFGSSSILALHDHDSRTAWTNLLAGTRLVTAWEVEPVEISQLTRFDCLRTIYYLTWQVLQADGWTDDELAQLQREWESCDLFKSLPDSIAFTSACYDWMIRLELKNPQPLPAWSFSFRAPFRSISDLRDRWRQKIYRSQGIYDKENEALLYYRDRQLEIRGAIQTASWAEMRKMAGVTNRLPFQSSTRSYGSTADIQFNLRNMMMALQDLGIGLMGNAADAEARRRVIITAIAVERFHTKRGAYPDSLAQLVPEFLNATPVDFMDGHPLRYRRTDDGHFVLYSTGMDCVDNGGKLVAPVDPRQAMIDGSRSGPLPPDSDLVWPAPASASEAEAHALEKERQLKAQEVAREQEAAREEAEAEASRQAARDLLLSDSRFKKTTWTGSDTGAAEPVYNKQPLSKFLSNEKSAGQPSLDSLFTLKQVITGSEPAIITYQLPISYDALKGPNEGSLTLAMDSPPREPALGQPELEVCERATNGDCLLIWNTAVERPGLHAMQAVLMLYNGGSELTVKGPAAPFWSSNLCQFSPGSSLFDDSGAPLYARVVESNANYSIEIKTHSGSHIKTLTGSTTNGVIDIEWDLHDDKGQTFTGNSFISHFNITLPDSGRSQTLKQPQNKVGTRGD